MTTKNKKKTWFKNSTLCQQTSNHILPSYHVVNVLSNVVKTGPNRSIQLVELRIS